MANPILRRRRPTPEKSGPFRDLDPMGQAAALALHHMAKQLGIDPDTLEGPGVDALRDWVDALGLRGMVWPAGKCRCCGRIMPITNATGARDNNIRHGYCSRTCSNAAEGKA